MISMGHAHGIANDGLDFDSYSSIFATLIAIDTDNSLFEMKEEKQNENSILVVFFFWNWKEQNQTIE